MRKAVIVDYVRTPFHFAKKGALIDVRPDDLAAIAIRALVDRTGIDVREIEDVLMGCSYPEAEQGSNIARLASLLAGLPNTLGGATINRFCGSSMSAIHTAAGAIAADAGDVFICAGIESMTRVPQGGFNRSNNPRFRSAENWDAEIPIQAYLPMGLTAENVAQRFGVSRQDQDGFAVLSHRKAAAARAEGRLAGEIVPVATPDGTVTEDGCIRPQSTVEALAALKPVFREDGVVTAATSSPLTDGASATLIVSEDYAKAHGLKPLARIRSMAIAGVEPEIMGMGPVPATRKALSRAGLGVSDIQVAEVNEAFASQAIACLRELELPIERVNLDGGGIAIGHPLGATGARITGKAAQLLVREDGEFALSTQCIGGGQGIATVLERI